MENGTGREPAEPKPYVAPRTGLRQAKSAGPLAALLAVAAGAVAAVVLFFAAALTGGSSGPAYVAFVWIAIFGMMVFSALKHRWWLTLFFVLGVLPTAFVMMLLFNFCC